MNNFYEKKTISLFTFSLGLYFFFVALDPVGIASGISVTKLLTGICIFLSVLKIKEIKVKFNILTILPAVFVIYNFISIIYSSDSSVSLKRSMTIAFLYIFTIIITSMKYSCKELKFLSKMTFYSGWLVIVLVLLFPSPAQRLTFEINGYHQDQNTLIGYMLITLIYNLQKFLKTRNIKWLLGFSILMFFILLTGSRGGLIAALASILMYFMFSSNSTSKVKNIINKIFIIFILGIVIAIIMSYLPQDISERFTIEFSKKDGGAGRFKYWTILIENFKNSSSLSQLFGHGAGTIKIVNGFVAHNLWLEILMDLGILGLGIMGVKYLIYLIKSMKNKDILIASVFVGYLILSTSLSLTTFKPIWNLFILIILNIKYNTDYYK